MIARRLTISFCVLTLLGLATVAAQAQRIPERSTQIFLASGVLDTGKTAAEIPAGLNVAAGDPGSDEIVLVKFPAPVTAAQLEVLGNRAERVYTYLPHDAFLIKIPRARQQRLKDAGLGVRWIGPYHPAYKISPAVAAVAAGKADAVESRRSVLIHVFPDADLADVTRRVELLELGEVVASGAKSRFSRLRLLMTPAEIAAARERLARLAEVFWIGLEPRRVLLNDTTVWVAQSGTAGGQRTPIYDRGIFGQGQTIAILDTGIDADMCYFRDPARGLPPQNVCGGNAVDRGQRKVIAVDFLWASECADGITADEWDTQDHGTHVAGIAAGDDFARPGRHDPGDGMAPGAKLVIQDCGFAVDDCADCPGIGCPVVDLNPVFQQTFHQGARIHSNSWGDEENNPDRGRYSAGSEDADEFMWNHKDFLLVFAAGNAGPGAGSVTSPATAKNVVAAGATLRGPSAETMASFSSCGRTRDGRVKPDVTMPGTSIMSADSDNDATSFNCNVKPLSGTSMAAPGVAGALALIRQYFTGGWYPSGEAVAADSLTPSAALLKATLINSGHDMTGVGPIPADCQGWGRVLLDDALHFRGQSRKLFVADDSAGFAQGSSAEERSYPFFVGAGTAFKATLTWTDFPSTPAAAQNLVNDLDLEVRGPGGTYLGNVFAGGASATGGRADRADSVEQVLLRNPAAGVYTVTVRSFNVPRGPQPFALAVTGDLGSCVTNADCDDGAFCNGAETCAAGTCQAGIDPCDDGVECTADVCDEEVDSCASSAEDARCNDGSRCNGVETCDPVLDCRAGELFDCAADDSGELLCLNDDRFCVEAAWTDFEGQPGSGRRVPLTADSGYFWFFDDANVELIVKVLDACVAPFDRFWVFAAGLTNVGVELTVTDLVTGEVNVYPNPIGTAFPPILDTDAFATCAAQLPAVPSPDGTLAELERLLVGASLTFWGGRERGPVGPSEKTRFASPVSYVRKGSPTCEPSATALCLNGGRFRVEALWEALGFGSGSGRAVELTGDTGYFWFFDDANVEVVVKVLDACVDPFQHFWVFAAGLTNVEVTLRVTDTLTGEVREYRNPQGTAFRPIQDVEAFATCP